MKLEICNPESHHDLPLRTAGVAVW
jgi:hypothetical protein